MCPRRSLPAGTNTIKRPAGVGVVALCRWVSVAFHLPSALLHVDEQVALEDKFAFLVFLRGLVCLVIFPAQGGATLDAVDIPHSVVPRSHRAIVGFAFNDIHDAVEQVCSAVLPIEGPGYHGMDGSEMSPACRAAVDTFARKIASITHAHGC